MGNTQAEGNDCQIETCIGTAFRMPYAERFANQLSTGEREAPPGFRPAGYNESRWARAWRCGSSTLPLTETRLPLLEIFVTDRLR